MTNNLKEIQNSYGEDIFRLAITHLLHVGIHDCSRQDIDALCEMAISNTPDNALMSGEYQAIILRCAKAICDYSVDDLLKFIKTDVSMAGIPAHIGSLIAFRANATYRLIFSCMLPHDTDPDVLDELTHEIERTEDVYEEKHGSLYGFDLRSAIEDAAKRLGIRIEPIPYDKEIYI